MKNIYEKREEKNHENMQTESHPNQERDQQKEAQREKGAREENRETPILSRKIEDDERYGRGCFSLIAM